MRDDFRDEAMDTLELGPHHGTGFSTHTWSKIMIPTAKQLRRLQNVNSVRVSYLPEDREYYLDLQLRRMNTMRIVRRGQQFFIRRKDGRELMAAGHILDIKREINDLKLW